MKLVWRLNLWRMAKLREFNQLCAWNAPGGLPPEFRVISELLGYLRRSAIRREGGPVELADHQRCRAADTLELVHDRLSERHVEDARLHPTYNLSPRPSKHTGEHLDSAVVFRVPLAGVIDPLLIILDAVEIRLSLDNQLLIDLKIWRSLRLPSCGVIQQLKEQKMPVRAFSPYALCYVDLLCLFSTCESKQIPRPFFQCPPQKACPYKRARVVDVGSPTNNHSSIPDALEMTGGFGADVKRNAVKKRARRATGPSRTYHAYGVPY
jgi:hypothetical protein